MTHRTTSGGAQVSDTARVIQVIETTILRKGDGKDERSPVRIVTQYFTLDGNLLAETDPCSVTFAVEDEMHERCSAEEHRRNQAQIRFREMYGDAGSPRQGTGSDEKGDGT